MDTNNYYHILGVPANATTDDIIKAYKKLEITTHPDKNRNDPDATIKFQRLLKAYEVLSHPMERVLYDISQGYEPYEPDFGDNEETKETGHTKEASPDNREYKWSGFKTKGKGPSKRSNMPEMPQGVWTAGPQKPWPGAYRYTEDGVPVGKEEESKPEKAEEEWKKWQEMLSRPPKPANPAYWWSGVKFWSDVDHPDQTTDKDKGI